MIELKDITIKYNDEFIHQNFNAKFTDGTINILTGPSGCGKTTILNIIGLINQDFSGKLIINDQECQSLNTKARLNLYRKEIGFLFQNFGLVENESIKQNLLIGLKYKKIKKKDKIAMIEKTVNSLGIKHDLNQKIYRLSGGEQQRVALARLILKDSKIILADEPTGSLDKQNAKLVMNSLKKFRDEGKIIVMVTHDTELINDADQWIELR